jgi:RHS repeat-associated protein
MLGRVTDVKSDDSTRTSRARWTHRPGCTWSWAVGSTSIVLDLATGELVERSTALAYGGIDSDYRAARWQKFREEYRFTGKEDDVELGLVYFGKRYYAPALGRWISADPLSVHVPGRGGLNAYAYVDGKALSAVDPHGLVAAWVVGAAIGAAIGAGAYIANRGFHRHEGNWWKGLGVAAGVGAVSGATGAAVGNAAGSYATTWLSSPCWGATFGGAAGGAVGGGAGYATGALLTGSRFDSDELGRAMGSGAAWGAAGGFVGHQSEDLWAPTPKEGDRIGLSGGQYSSEEDAVKAGYEDIADISRRTGAEVGFGVRRVDRSYVPTQDATVGHGVEFDGYEESNPAVAPHKALSPGDAGQDITAWAHTHPGEGDTGFSRFDAGYLMEGDGSQKYYPKVRDLYRLDVENNEVYRLDWQDTPRMSPEAIKRLNAGDIPGVSIGKIYPVRPAAQWGGSIGAVLPLLRTR